MAGTGARLGGAWPGVQADAAGALLLWLAAGVVMIATLPLLPVDETRYLTVAWEMRESGQWLLPTLNGVPYSHKPPLMLWLVNGVWTGLGAEIWAARLVPLAATAGVLAMTYRLARELYPEREDTPSLAMLLLLASPAVFVYGTLLMFDLLLAVWVLIGLSALWRAAHAPTRSAWGILGLALGLGLITKGPVILLHLVPPALLASFWRPGDAGPSHRHWLGSLLASLAIGAALVLAWAVPAAIIGGPEYAHMIFWKQSAGRMVEAFHHRQPFWFYVPVAAAFLMPLLFWPPLWRAIASLKRQPVDRPTRFLLSWLLPAFLTFSLLSGKQPHYLLPLLPGVALVAAGLLRGAGVHPGDGRTASLPYAALFLVLLVGPIVAARAGIDSPTGFVSQGLAAFNPLLTLAAGVPAILALLLARSLRAQALALAAAGALLITTVSVQCHANLFRHYDLAPLAAALQPYKDGPLAYVGQYAGELGYLARLERPLVTVRRGTGLMRWLDQNPAGVAIMRHKASDGLEGLSIVHSQPFRARGLISIVRKAA